MSGKLSKQELKEPDKFQIMLSQVMMVLAENKQKLYIAGGVLAVLLVIAGGWYLYDLNIEKRAQQIYARGYDTATGDGAAAVGIFKDVVAKYPGSRAAALANYRLANLYYRQNDFDGAIKAYEASLQRTPDNSDLKALAYMGLAYSYEAKKDFKNALAAFEKASTGNAGQVFEGMNNQNIARVYEAMNDRAKALEYYQKALTKNTDPVVEILIKRRIATLG